LEEVQRAENDIIRSEFDTMSMEIEKLLVKFKDIHPQEIRSILITQKKIISELEGNL